MAGTVERPKSKEILDYCIRTLMDDNRYTLKLQKYVLSNGGICRGFPFSKAQIITEPLFHNIKLNEVTQQKLMKTESFTEIFLTVFDIVMVYVQQNKKPENEELERTFDQLLDYLSNIKSAEERLKCDRNGMTRVTVHYLAALSVYGDFRVNKFTKNKIDRCSCPCAQRILHTDTNIGNPHTWYGKPDVLIGRFDGEPEFVCPVAVTSLSSENGSDEAMCSSSSKTLNEDSPHGKTQAEVQLSSLETELPQVQAQTIVFSFYQRKRHPEVGLIPCIAVSKTHIQFHFYDCEKDIYLMSNELPLFTGEDDRLNCVTIMATWLVVNYKQLITGVTNEMENESRFGLLNAFSPEAVEYYKSDIVMSPFETTNYNAQKDDRILTKRRKSASVKRLKLFES
ncbi:hypothetical protein FSP39_006213 [Pinctada imbricata]|uniref:Uncharacterized protein n=1 Tax=Pinctada imbricata TaxID=66713 RepID=A0AA88XQE8_PINIB|nr:hypothetical protein FSP39_006213 [Pinctada imbricata]